jgi:hypothetical protein
MRRVTSGGIVRRLVFVNVIAGVSGGWLSGVPAHSIVHAQQPVGEHYDTSKTVTLKGLLRGRIGLPPPSPMILILHVPDAKGQVETWIIAGNTMASLRRDGWQLIGPNTALDRGEEISLTVYLPKDTQKAVQALAAVAGTMPSGGPPGYIADIEQKRARLAYGLEITKADGRKLRFGDAP